MRTIFLFFSLVLFHYCAFGQNNDIKTKIIIITNDPDFNKTDVDITIKSKGKKMQTDNADIDIIVSDNPEEFKVSSDKYLFDIKQFGGLDFNFDDFKNFDDSSIFDDLKLFNDSTHIFKFKDDLKNFKELVPNIEIDTIIDNGKQVIRKKMTIVYKDNKISNIEKEEEKHQKDPLKKYKKVDNQPLIYINGELFDGSLEEIDPKKIESVNVLKDKAAISLYGEKAINGVIEIKLKE